MVQDIVWKGKSYGDEVEREIGMNLRKAALFLEGDIKDSFGREPGTPNVVTTRLKESIVYERSGQLEYMIGSQLEKEGGQPYSYAYYLEYGFRVDGTIYRYPFLRSSLDRNNEMLMKLIGRRLRVA